MINSTLAKKNGNTVLEKHLEKNKNVDPDITPRGVYDVFCIDDDLMMRSFLRNTLKQNKNQRVHLFESGEDCLSALRRKQPDIIILDYHLSTQEDDNTILNGLEILEKIKELSPSSNVIMLSSQNEISVAIECLKKGAKDYIIKDNVMSVNIEKAINSVIKSLELRQEILFLSQKIKRDKLLIKGYFFIFLFLIAVVAFLVFK